MRWSYDPSFAPYLERYRKGEWRAYIFRDLILDEAGRMRRCLSETAGTVQSDNSTSSTAAVNTTSAVDNDNYSLLSGTNRPFLTFLDIGCGNGFDGADRVQGMIAPAADCYIGVEPDASIDLGNRFHKTYRTLFEDAAIEPESVDIAFAVMVTEHLENPALFWSKLYRVLKPNGVGWIFTVDARHPFVTLSRLAGGLGVKQLYLRWLKHETEGLRTHKCYRTWYRCNTPSAITKQAQAFSRVDLLNFARVGQMDYYLPSFLIPAGRCIELLALSCGVPGSILAARVEK